jgi:Fe-S-cluster containining protein
MPAAPARPARVTLALAGPHTRILSSLCARCPYSPSGCCTSPPPFDWADLARVAALGGVPFLREQIALGNLTVTPQGLRIRRTKGRPQPGQRRHLRCVFLGPEGCSIDPDRRPATCNYYVCEEGLGGPVRGPVDAGAPFFAHATLRELWRRWNEAVEARVAATWPAGPGWDDAFFSWLVALLRELEAEAGFPPSHPPPGVSG